MSSETYPKTVQVSMTEAQHEKLRGVAFVKKVSMQECVRGLIEGLDVDGVVRVVNPGRIVSKAVSVRPEDKSIGGVMIGPLVERDVEKKRCASCNLLSGHWVYDKKGQPICDDCAERLANSNP